MTCYTHMLVLFLAVVSWHACSGYPQYWIDPALNTKPPSPAGPPGCLDHPTRAWGSHKDPVTTTTIAFSVSNAKGKSVNVVCPGQTYTVKIETPWDGFALLTASQGTLSMSSDTCTGRVAFDPNYNSKVSDISATWTTGWTLPCTAADTAELKLTAAAFMNDAFHQNSVTPTVDATCGCSAGTKATPATKATPPTSSTPTPTTSTAAGTVTSFTAPMCKQPVQTSNTTCPKSALGYACSSTLDGMTLHYTVGGCPPSNPCTASYALRNPSVAAAQPYLHMAASYPTTGYVSVGFARNPGSMPGTDAVIGWVMDDGTPRINSYYVAGTSVSSSNMYSQDSQWMVLAGVVQDGGITTICFSRPVDAPSSKIAPKLLGAGAVGMNFARGSNGQKALTQHAKAGGFKLDPALGGVSATLGYNFMLVHGVLMGLAWIELIPLGVLLARHKALMGERKLGGVHVWFHLHRAVQLVAVALFVAGFALAYVKLGEPGGGIGKAHGILAIVLMVLVGIQVLAAFIRPKPGTPMRKNWNLLHWNLGRLSAAVGIANTYVGVKVYKRERLENVTVWYIVISVILGVYLAADVLLSVWGRKSAADQQQTSSKLEDAQGRAGAELINIKTTGGAQSGAVSA